ncbi:MAG TPA: choice-of-anchor H family protein [Woeseiaceae bacterium]|nr:choice-of-anchor H family protein [Woeseiaceae bacterium]
MLGLLIVAGAWAGEGDVRRSTSAQHEGGRDVASQGPVTEDRYGPLVTGGERTRPGARQGRSKTGGSSLQSMDHEFWIFFADVVLFGDDDEDGHFYGIDLLFDADTIFEQADVYAVLYLSLEGGPWNEYHVTDTFRIFGATSDDEYNVVTELESGYPRGSYDLLIELYDTFDGSFVASLGPIDTSELSFLPLEDFERDDPHFLPPVSHSHEHGGGAMGLAVLGVLGLFAALSMFRRWAQLRDARCTADRWVARGTGSYTAGSGVAGSGVAGSRRAVRMTLRPQAERLSK